MKLWRWQGRNVERATIEHAAQRASAKLDEWQRVVNKAASRLARSRGRDVAAEREGQQAERQLRSWGAKAREAMEALARGDRKKRDREKPVPGKWRYWVRASYSTARSGPVTVEVYFNQRQGRRLTDAEAVSAYYDLLIGVPTPDIVWHMVRYGKLSPNKRLGNRSEITNFAFVATSGDMEVEELGEEQYNAERRQWVRHK